MDKSVIIIITIIVVIVLIVIGVVVYMLLSKKPSNNVSTNPTVAPTTAPVKTARQKAIEFGTNQANQAISSGGVMGILGGNTILDLLKRPDGDSQKEAWIANTIKQQQFT